MARYVRVDRATLVRFLQELRSTGVQLRTQNEVIAGRKKQLWTDRYLVLARSFSNPETYEIRQADGWIQTDDQDQRGPSGCA